MCVRNVQRLVLNLLITNIVYIFLLPSFLQRLVLFEWHFKDIVPQPKPNHNHRPCTGVNLKPDGGGGGRSKDGFRDHFVDLIARVYSRCFVARVHRSPGRELEIMCQVTIIMQWCM